MSARRMASWQAQAVSSRVRDFGSRSAGAFGLGLRARRRCRDVGHALAAAHPEGGTVGAAVGGAARGGGAVVAQPGAARAAAAHHDLAGAVALHALVALECHAGHAAGLSGRDERVGSAREGSRRREHPQSGAYPGANTKCMTSMKQQAGTGLSCRLYITQWRRWQARPLSRIQNAVSALALELTRQCTRPRACGRRRNRRPCCNPAEVRGCGGELASGGRAPRAMLRQLLSATA